MLTSRVNPTGQAAADHRRPGRREGRGRPRRSRRMRQNDRETRGRKRPQDGRGDRNRRQVVKYIKRETEKDRRNHKQTHLALVIEET